MNLIKILHTVEKGFLLYTFISTLSPFSIFPVLLYYNWYIVFRVLYLLMLKIYRLLSIPEGDSGERHRRMDSMPLPSLMSRTSARLQAHKIQTS